MEWEFLCYFWFGELWSFLFIWTWFFFNFSLKLCKIWRMKKKSLCNFLYFSSAFFHLSLTFLLSFKIPKNLSVSKKTKTIILQRWYLQKYIFSDYHLVRFRYRFLLHQQGVVTNQTEQRKQIFFYTIFRGTLLLNIFFLKISHGYLEIKKFKNFKKQNKLADLRDTSQNASLNPIPIHHPNQKEPQN